MDENLIEALDRINKRLDALELSTYKETTKENCSTEVNNSDDSSRPVDTNNGDYTATGRSRPRANDQRYYIQINKVLTPVSLKSKII